MPRVLLDSSPLRTESAASDTSFHDAPSTHAQRHRPLKRSASTASLLTPPQTIQTKGRYAHTRSRSRGSRQGSDEDEEDEDVGGASPSRRRLVFGRKRQRTDRLDAVLASTLGGKDDENPFWDGDGDGGPSTSTAGNNDAKAGTVRGGEEKSKATTTTDKSNSDVGVVFNFRGKAPVSPPPSRRQTSVHKRRQSESAPSTPKAKVKERRVWSDTEELEGDPVRDSPNNPFLDDSPMSVIAEPVEPRTPTEHAEKPTLSYVFRGVKATFANPLYNLPSEIHERSLLPVDHPEYSPDPTCPPKLLFAEARRKKQPSTSPTRGISRRANRPIVRHHADEWDDSEDELHVTPPKRLVYRES